MLCRFFIGFVSLGKHTLEVRFKLFQCWDGDDADAEVVDIHLLKAFPVLSVLFGFRALLA